VSACHRQSWQCNGHAFFVRGVQLFMLDSFPLLSSTAPCPRSCDVMCCACCLWFLLSRLGIPGQDTKHRTLGCSARRRRFDLTSLSSNPTRIYRDTHQSIYPFNSDPSPGSISSDLARSSSVKVPCILCPCALPPQETNLTTH
jgi:hypothetical protein